jgi:DNA-binding LacI/PurR family transcriptional regulator
MPDSGSKSNGRATRRPASKGPAEAPPARARAGAPADQSNGSNGQASRLSRIPTMQDIARASGVSQSTVSRVLTGAPTVVPINPATRERVLEVARQMRYRPNPLARGLRGARTMLLGVIVREITDPFFAGAVDAISSEANRRGYNVVLGHAHGKTDEAIALRAVLETRHCDAILLLGDTSDQPRLLGDLRDTNITVVGLWQGSTPVPGIPTVSVDNRAGVDALMGHLIGLGHRRLAFIGGGFGEGLLLGDIGERRAAFLELMAAADLPVPDDYVCEIKNNLSGGASAFESLMRLPVPPTAILASTDLLAIGAIHAAGRMGLTVPGDVSIVGFDDMPMAEYTNPALTTVRQPMAEMAAVGVGAAIDNAGAQDAPVVKLLLPSLIVRESSGPPPSRAG